jgi:hypothetical protein
MIQNEIRLQQARIQAQNIKEKQWHLHKHKKIIKHKTMLWNFKSSKVIGDHTTWDYILWKNISNLVHT